MSTPHQEVQEAFRASQVATSLVHRPPPIALPSSSTASFSSSAIAASGAYNPITMPSPATAAASSFDMAPLAQAITPTPIATHAYHHHAAPSAHSMSSLPLAGSLPQPLSGPLPSSIPMALPVDSFAASAAPPAGGFSSPHSQQRQQQQPWQRWSSRQEPFEQFQPGSSHHRSMSMR